jgi:myosin I
MRPGDVTDKTFLDKLDSKIISNEHYDSRIKSKSDRTFAANPTAFRLKHYAGDVDYNVEGFVAKNTDALSRDVLDALNASRKSAFKEMFPESEKDDNMKRPDTLGMQFKGSMAALIENLMSKSPHYIRCIKPNSEKRSTLFDEQLVMHQCRYLGYVHFDIQVCVHEMMTLFCGQDPRERSCSARWVLLPSEASPA